MSCLVFWLYCLVWMFSYFDVLSCFIFTLSRLFLFLFLSYLVSCCLVISCLSPPPFLIGILDADIQGPSLQTLLANDKTKSCFQVRVRVRVRARTVRVRTSYRLGLELGSWQMARQEAVSLFALVVCLCLFLSRSLCLSSSVLVCLSIGLDPSVCPWVLCLSFSLSVCLSYVSVCLACVSIGHFHQSLHYPNPNPLADLFLNAERYSKQRTARILGRG
jgi:hypothetical protein